MCVAARFILLLSCLFMEVGACEIIFRFWNGKRGHLQNVRFTRTAIAFAAGLSGIFMLLLWEGEYAGFIFIRKDIICFSTFRPVSCLCTGLSACT